MDTVKKILHFEGPANERASLLAVFIPVALQSADGIYSVALLDFMVLPGQDRIHGCLSYALGLCLMYT
jgi:hypothetical protein